MRRNRIRMIRRNLLALLAVGIGMLIPAACLVSDPYDASRLDSLAIESRFLQKTMSLKVYLPPAYDPEGSYPVLYFLPDYGGSDHTVINDYAIGESADALTNDGRIQPLIIVAVATDPSFGLNSASVTRMIETASGKRFAEGRYEDYIIQEVIPLIDSRYPTTGTRSGRYIGGYSAGGFAALYLAFRHPDLFAKVGGHSPSLFPAAFPDQSVSDWLYPDAATRRSRDPIQIAADQDLTGLAVYLDTGEADPNIAGCAILYELLLEKGLACENHLFPGSHSRPYCRQYMPDYLLFYGNE